MDIKVFDSLAPQVLQEMYDKMDFRSVKDQLEKSGNSTSSSGEGHLELSLPSLEITNLSISDRPSPSASPELQSGEQTKKLKSTHQSTSDAQLGSKYPYASTEQHSSRAQMIQDLKAQLTGTSSTDWPNQGPKRSWSGQVSPERPVSGDNLANSYETSSSNNSRDETPDITPLSSPEGTNKILSQVQKHFTSATVLSPGIPGLLPPLISSTPYVGGSLSRVHTRSFSENDALVVKQNDEPVHQKPFRPWEIDNSRSNEEIQIKNEAGINPKPQRTGSLSTAPGFEVPIQPCALSNQNQPHQEQLSYNELDPLRKAMVLQHSKLVDDLSWLQQHRPNDTHVFTMCRDYSAQVDHLERLRSQALVMATACPEESMSNINNHYDQQRLELLRSTTQRISTVRVASFQYAFPYRVPDILPVGGLPFYHPIPMGSQFPSVASNYFSQNCQPPPQPLRSSSNDLKHRKRSDTKTSIKMETNMVKLSQASPVDSSTTSGSFSSDSAYHSNISCNNSSCNSNSYDNSSSSASDTSSSSASGDNLKLIEHVDKLCPHYEYNNIQMKAEHPSKVNYSKENRLLNRQAVRCMEHWYNLHFDHPYPSDTEAHELAMKGGITVAQVKKWMANKRVRSYNTLSFNGSIHPRKLKRLQKQQDLVYNQLSRANMRYNPIAMMPRM